MYRLNIVQPSVKNSSRSERLMAVGKVHHGKCVYEVSVEASVFQI